MEVADLEIGGTYFSVQFIDDAMYIPIVEPLVYLGSDPRGRGSNSHLFQDAGSHQAGIRMEDREVGDARFYSQPASQLGHIFEFERGLEVLLRCSVERKGGSAT